MSTYTPTTEQVRRYWLYGANVWAAGLADDTDTLDPVDGEPAGEKFDRWLATVRPNPDDARQVEVGARALCKPDYEGDLKVCAVHSHGPQWYLNSGACEIGRQHALAVLTALAAMGGERA